MLVTLDSLVIEITRHCNMQCGHCLRGQAEEMTMDLSYVEEIFKQVGRVSSITFSGGEPFLYPEIIDAIVALAGRHQVDFGNFYIATNGTVPMTKVVNTIFNLYNYCDENEISTIKVSNDQYHRYAEIHKIHLEEWSLLQFVEIEERDIPDNGIIAEGFGEPIGVRPATSSKIDVDIWDIEEEEISVNLDCDLYLNCKGNIIRGCDFSYEHQEDEENIWCTANELQGRIKFEVEMELNNKKEAANA